MDQPKVERMLKLMMMLTGNLNYSVSDLSEKLEMSERTIYRYIDTFKAAGFVIKKGNGNVYHIDKSSRFFKDISELIHFSKEEAFLLKRAIDNIDENNIIKQNLKKKLYSVYDYKILANIVVKVRNGQNVDRLAEAIESKKKVVLKNYKSANSNEICDRIVEPFSFTTNYIQIWSFDTEDNTNKLFNVSRMDEVEILNHNWKDEEKHKEGFTDCFRIHSNNLYPIKLKLGIRATQLLTEEYPLAEEHLEKVNDNEWIFEADVCSYEGIGRFVIGLLYDISIVDSPDFEEFVKERIKSYSTGNIVSVILPGEE